MDFVVAFEFFWLEPTGKSSLQIVILLMITAPWLFLLHVSGSQPNDIGEVYVYIYMT